jgi:methyl-accepting chemotaxis protein
MTFSFALEAVTHAPLLLVQSAAPSGFEHWVDVIADVATIVIALALILGAFVAIYGALKVRAMLRGMRTDFEPAIRNANALSENVKALSEKVRGNVEELSETVSDTNQKVRRAAEAAEARLAELNALVGVAQREAEDAFVRAASTVRGVQVGTKALRRLARRGGRDDYEGELDDLLDDEAMDAEDDVTEIRVTPPGRRGRHILD